jgi:hypothetical protein
MRALFDGDQPFGEGCPLWIDQVEENTQMKTL